MHTPILLNSLKWSVLVAATTALLGRPAFADDLLATGQTVTPTAAPGSRLLDLNPGLQPIPGVQLLPGQDVTRYVAGQPEATVISPDGKTLLVMTSGFNGLADVSGNVIFIVEDDALGAVRSRRSSEWWAKAFAGLDFSREDRNDAAKFNRILWEGMMGGKPYPGDAPAVAKDAPAVAKK